MRELAADLRQEEVLSIDKRVHFPAYNRWPLLVDRAEGLWLEDTNGDRFLDLYGSHAVSAIGHRHPKMLRALQDQMDHVIYVSNVFHCKSRALALQHLTAVCPSGLCRVFLVNSGAEAVENAVKIARRFSGRKKVISFEGSFHGRTAAALSATGIKQYREAFKPSLPGHQILPFGDIEALEASIDDETAAVLVEPIQSMAGVRTAPWQFFETIRQLCDSQKVLLLFDECQTGLGRTGRWFFGSRQGAVPDILILAKALAGGLPVGAIVVREQIATAFKTGDVGSTFGGGPFVSAAIAATIAIIDKENLVENARKQGLYLARECRHIRAVHEVRGEGLLIGLQFRRPAREIQKYLFGRQILVGTSNDPEVVRLLPPLTLQRSETDHFLNALGDLK